MDKSELEQRKNWMLWSFILVTSLFFAWGFITVFVDMLIPRLKSLFELNYARTMLIQFGFFTAYFVVSIPASRLVSRLGYRPGIIIGLLVMALGAGLFFPAAQLRVFGIFIFALFVLASGMTILQVAANPLVALLGPSRTAPVRLNLAQAFNSLGTTLAPMAGAVLLLGLDVLDSDELAALSPEALETYRDASANAVQGPFMLIAAALIAIAVVFALIKIYSPTFDSEDLEAMDLHPAYPSALASRPLKLGVLAIFLYVGAEVAIGSFLVNYFIQDDVADITAKAAASLVTFYWGGAMVGRFVGAFAMRFAPARLVLSAASIMALLLVLATLAMGGKLSMWTILAVGFFNSIHFPTIFTLAISRLGEHTAKASGYLCMAIVGGAIVPVLMGFAADQVGIRFAFILPALCYLYLWFYAAKGSRHPA